WVLAAWEIYKVTGDQEWLSQAFTIIKNTVEDDLKTLKAENGLFMGESSFLDWREQTYPRWMDNKDIFASQSLGTNAVHYQTYTILAQMADILGEPSQRYVDEADKIKEAINNLLWLEDKGYYAQYTYGRKSFMTSGRFEALGESFMILFDIADVERKKQILSSSPHTPYGVTCIYPQIPAIPPYHNDGIWPFVQAYWNWAAAQTGNEKALKHGLASIYRASALFLTNKENFVAQNGDFQGTEINSDRQLWSVAGNLAMVYRVFMGINFEQDGIRFSPSIPEVYEGVKSLKGFKYREAKLDITVKGYGNQIASITMDGKPLSDGFFHGNVTGNHEITITMDNRPFGIDGINLVDNAFSPETPIANLQNNVISWRPVEGSTNYKIYKNGELISETSDTS
ncbi:MAG: glycogen debranching protein, partial [Bacteroidota bacterium]